MDYLIKLITPVFTSLSEEDKLQKASLTKFNELCAKYKTSYCLLEIVFVVFKLNIEHFRLECFFEV